MKTQNESHFISIVVIAYNEEKGIELTLRSLLNQDYPKDKYEIILIDDCSKDKTVEIAKRFPVKLIRHKTNLGRANARNTGLKYAKGDIYVCFDGDCIADKNWLKELIFVYKFKKDVLGVGGKIFLDNPKSLTDKFIQSTGCGNPSPIYMTRAKSLFARFKSYLLSKFKSLDDNSIDVIKVGNIMGANSSFYIKDLRKIKGWDTNLNVGEDTYICYRLKKKFKDKEFYISNKSKIIHNHRMGFSDYLKRSFFRGKDIIKVYKKQNKSLPIFPFPISIVFLSLLFLYMGVIPFIISLFVLPQIFYTWNIVNFFKKFDFHFLIFPYMHFLVEFLSILGLIRGQILNKCDYKKN